MPDPTSNASPPKASALFMGTPQFAVPSLLALAEHPHVALHAVVTQPDRPQGRGQRLRAPAVKETAQRIGLPVFQPATLKEEPFQPVLQQLPPLDFIFVVAFAKKIPPYLLNYPRLGCINLHPSLLPKYRGGAPMRRAIFAGETQTGITTMILNEGWDTGDLICQETVAIAPETTYGELSELLADRGARLMEKTVEQMLAGTAPRTPQDDRLATHEPLLKPEEEWIDWSLSAETILNRVRGLCPQPVAKTYFRGSILKLFRVHALPTNSLTASPPGTVIESSKSQGILIATGSGALQLEQLQPAGKRMMSAIDFRNGYQVKTGEIFMAPQ